MRRIKVVSIQNWTHERGVDRVILVARALKPVADRVHFHLYGKCLDKRAFCDQIVKRANALPNCTIHGYSENLMETLRQADIVIRLGRYGDSWGRDIVEGMAAGCAIVATGQSAGFVDQGEGGYLFPKFIAGDVAEKILMLADKPELLDRMKLHNAVKTRELFDGPTQADKVVGFYKKLLNVRGAS